MKNLNSYYRYHHNSLIISKSSIQQLTEFPKIKKVLVFFLIDTKYYKKNLLLFCIVINLIFGLNPKKKKKKEIKGDVRIFSINLKNMEIFIFLKDFVYLYLPLLSTDVNCEKQGTLLLEFEKSVYKEVIYRIDYFKFPVIMQLDAICSNFEMIQHFVNNYKLRIEFYLRQNTFFKESNEFFIRMHRIPCYFRLKSRL